MESWEATSSEPYPPGPVERAPEGTPLYVHLPFCASKCHYCDFFSLPDEGQDIAGTVAAILREAEARAPRHPRTVFFGGGTPSLLDESLWHVLADGLQRITGFRDSAVEVTAECNPESLDESKARCLLDLGVRRLSIGFQTLRDERLQLFGRVHDTAQSFRAFEAARRAGVESLNVDLIFGSPDQTLEEWHDELTSVLDLGPETFSAYNLTYEEGTAFHRWRAEGRLHQAPEDLELALFHATRELARARGYEPYEISNFGLPDRRCEHNLNYWRNGPYLGLGPSAVSKLGHRRSGNPRALKPYLDRVAEHGDPSTWSETLAPEHRLAETWWLGLRLPQGVDPAEAARTAGCAPEPGRDMAQTLANKGLLESHGTRYRLTARGLPLADAVAAEFLRRLPTETPGREPIS